jgi:Spherulation-specific family 4
MEELGHLFLKRICDWGILNGRVDNHASTQFLVVVNPNNGQGNETLSDPVYITELQKVNNRSNVITVGYVSTEYGTRNISDVFDDVDTYALYSRSNVTMDGIFFDQTPFVYGNESAAFMDQINNYVKQHGGFGGDNFVMRPLMLG